MGGIRLSVTANELAAMPDEVRECYVEVGDGTFSLAIEGEVGGDGTLPVGTVLRHPCPDCGAPMILRRSRYGLFYGCARFKVGCRGAHGAHPDGRPMGVPGDAVTRRARHEVHGLFDMLWKAPGARMNRTEAYAWMRAALNMTAEEAHISAFSREQCRALRRAVESYLGMGTDELRVSLADRVPLGMFHGMADVTEEEI